MEPNEYTTIIIDEAQRRSISVELCDPSTGEMIMQLGDRSVRTIQSLSELTSAIGYLNCDDKARSRDVLSKAGLAVPEGRLVTDDQRDLDFIDRVGQVVIKPTRGEGGEGVTVGVGTEDLSAAVASARQCHPVVLMEQCCAGEDLRVLVIGQEAVAAAVRRPPTVTGDGRRPVRQLIAEWDDSAMPSVEVGIDKATLDHLVRQGFGPEDVPPHGTLVELRGTANVHTGGSIHDVTDRLNPKLAEVALTAASAAAVPVAGVDLLVPSVETEDYVVIEINEQPGLANHGTRPTARRFVDLLFPETTE